MDSVAKVVYFKSKEPCEQCKTRTFYEQDGKTWCKEGHDQGITKLFNQEEEDYVAPSSQGQTTRLKQDAKLKKSRCFIGIPALKLWLSCYQILLRHQCFALIHDKGINGELEPLVRDLWLLRLPRIIDTIGPRLRISDNGEETTDDDEAIGPKLYSSQTESTAGEATDTEGVPRREKRRELPSLVDSLALCYIGLTLLRAPISIGTLYQWAVREEVPFIRPLRLIPVETRRNLSTRWINLFETHHALSPDDLQRSLQRLVSQYQRHSELSLPPLNHQPLLLWYLHELALPYQLHTIVQHLAAHFSMTFAYPNPSMTRARKSTHHSLPELSLLALLVIAIKSYHPFPPSRTVFAESETDPAYLTIDWPHWSAAREIYRERLKAGKPFQPGTHMAVSEADVFSLDGAQLDSYMSWFDATWTEPVKGDGTSGDISRAIVDMFPTEHPAGLPLVRLTREDGDEQKVRRAKDERMESVVGRLKPRVVVSRERAERLWEEKGKYIRRAGEEYQVYWKKEQLTGVAREFHEELAERAAISVGKLLKEVRRLEVLNFKMERKARLEGRRSKWQMEDMSE